MSTSRASAALSVLVIHIFLVCALGQFYAKVPTPIAGLPTYPTELAILAMALLALGALSQVRWDALTKLVVAFLATGAFWAVIGGLGPIEGAGVKAFSFFVYSTIYFIIRATARTRKSRLRILHAIAVAAVFGALLGLWQLHTGSVVLDANADFVETSTGTTRWLPGEFALYGFLAAILVAVDAIFRKRLDPRSGILLCAAAIELVLAQHRSAFLAFAVALLATATLLGGSTQSLKGLLKLVLVGAIALFVFAYLFGGSYLEDTLFRIQHTGDVEDVNNQWRLLAWYEVGTGVIAQPLGHGFAVWDFVFNAQDPLTGSHNSFLDLTYRIGIVGFAFFAALPIVLISHTRALVRRLGARSQVMLISICGCLIAFLIFASFNTVLETPYFSIFFWVLLGVGAEELAAQRAGDQVSATDFHAPATRT